ncbi:MAG: GNAT family N-acetyltransferase, partial [Clostridia bacterium]|nr:GNAT family N-acetyltransferase [Clostridia bacterium]
MTEEAIALYRICFTEDSDAVCDVVFSQRLAQAEQRELFSDGRLVSVLWLVKKKMYFSGEVLPVPHVVGLCTHPDYRGRGFATELIRRTVSSLPGVPFLTLYPFSHEFYKRLGFATVSFDDDPPDRAEKVSAPTDLLEDLYRDFCAGADYYYIRNKADFDFYRAVNAPYGEGYALLDGGRKGFS